MRLACVLSLALVTFGAASARAQSPPCTNNGKLKLDLTLGLIVDDKQVAPAEIQSLLTQADCLCNSDLLVEIFAKTGIPVGSPDRYNIDVWVGTGCDNPVTRTQTCKKLDTQLKDTDFQTSGETLKQKVPARSVISPMSESCASGGGNFVYLIFYQQENSPTSVCTLSLPARLQLPTAPDNPGAGAGDKAVTVTWSIPPKNPPRYYQVLCATTDGNPARNAAEFEQGYTTCTTEGIKHRKFATGGSSTPTDAGVSTGDGGAGAVGPGPCPGSEHGSASGGAADGGTGSPTSGGPEPFTDLHPQFICSKKLEGSNTSVTVDGLENDVEYKFLVLAIDDFGNATPAAYVVTETPKPVEDLYRRFRKDGGAAQGFCFIATAAHGSPQSPYVGVLRRFRDEVLETTAGGRAFVDWYYEHAPPAAAWIAERPAARSATRVALWPVIGLAALWLWLGPGLIVLFGGGAGALLAWRGLRRRRGVA